MADPRPPTATTLKNLGLLPAELRLFIRPGAVWHARNEAITYATDRLPTAGEPEKKPFRRVIVIQAQELNLHGRLPTVQVVPCTGSPRSWPPPIWDFAIPSTEGRVFTKPRVVAYASQSQPILQSELHEHIGDLTAVALFDLQQVFRRNAGLLPTQFLPLDPDR